MEVDTSQYKLIGGEDMRGRIPVVTVVVVIVVGMFLGVDFGWGIKGNAEGATDPQFEENEIKESKKSTFPTHTQDELSFVPFLLLPVFMFFFITVEILDYITNKKSKVKSKKKSKKSSSNTGILSKNLQLLKDEITALPPTYNVMFVSNSLKPGVSLNADVGFEIMIENPYGGRF